MDLLKAPHPTRWPLPVLVLWMFSRLGLTDAWAAKPFRVIALGDSLTAGYGVPLEASFPAVLQRLLMEDGHREVELINAGISGSTTASGLGRAQTLLSKRPNVLILALGANDGLRGVPPSTIQTNLAAVIELAQAHQIKVLLVGMQLPASYFGASYTRAFAEVFQQLSTTYQVPLLPFLLQNVAADPALNLPDHLHPNEKGYVIIAHTVLAALQPFLDQK